MEGEEIHMVGKWLDSYVIIIHAFIKKYKVIVIIHKHYYIYCSGTGYGVQDMEYRIWSIHVYTRMTRGGYC